MRRITPSDDPIKISHLGPPSFLPFLFQTFCFMCCFWHIQRSSVRSRNTHQSALFVCHYQVAQNIMCFTKPKGYMLFLGHLLLFHKVVVTNNYSPRVISINMQLNSRAQKQFLKANSMARFIMMSLYLNTFDQTIFSFFISWQVIDWQHDPAAHKIKQ